ncbi:hypothetical protein J2Z48_002895 [Croceifilum oryzae]|uniref:Uncharacterized protein n=1 Tax=Croceifilum oryzae TaxID=1553429 RepID=A0AAJ1WRN0_9BACL|nr:hypothetical protein [Croceifilum oryzae]MDQ0418692.1 hypothetical protein [Croceifilum oryzae]
MMGHWTIEGRRICSIPAQIPIQQGSRTLRFAIRSLGQVQNSQSTLKHVAPKSALHYGSLR